MRELALPAPGGKDQLCEQVARIASRPLNRHRPLWELHLLSGLEGGQMALLVKFHHAATLVGYYPVSVVTDGLGLNITVQSYLDRLDIGLVFCRELVPDLEGLLGYLTEAIDELHEATSRDTG